MNKKIEPTENQESAQAGEPLSEPVCMNDEIEKLDNRLKDLDSRVQSIENFRNHPSIELKINNLNERLEEINASIDTLKKELKDVKTAVPA